MRDYEEPNKRVGFYYNTPKAIAYDERERGLVLQLCLLSIKAAQEHHHAPLLVLMGSWQAAFQEKFSPASRLQMVEMQLSLWDPLSICFLVVLRVDRKFTL